MIPGTPILATTTFMASLSNSTTRLILSSSFFFGHFDPEVFSMYSKFLYLKMWQLLTLGDSFLNVAENCEEFSRFECNGCIRNRNRNCRCYYNIYNESMYSFGLSATWTAKIQNDIMFKLHIKWAPKCRLVNG